jgi:hypothetical protein
MTGSSSIHIDALVLPGLDARSAERAAQALHARLSELEATDSAQGISWRQPEHAIDLTLDCGADGSVDTGAMAAAIRAHFVDRSGPA